MFFDKMSLININEFKILKTFFFCSSPNGRCIENCRVILLVRFSRVFGLRFATKFYQNMLIVADFTKIFMKILNFCNFF